MPRISNLRRYKKRVSKKPKAKKSIGPKSTNSMVSLIKKVIDSQTETKTATFYSNVTAFNQQVNSSGDCLRLIPQVPVGTGQGARVGNEIKAKRLHIRGVLTVTLGQTSVANLRLGVRMMIFRCKRFEDWQQTQTDFATSYTRLLEGSVNGLNGDLANWNAPPNRDYFSVVKDKRFVLTMGQGATTNEVFNAVRHYSFSIPYSKKTIKYDENYSSTDPVNYAYVMVLGYTKLDGSLPDLSATTYLTNQYVTTLTYEDA